jgi:mycofactocin system glycosyltransferase
MSTGLPDGFSVQIADGVKLRGNGEMLVGGTPTRVLRLSHQARGLIHHGRLTVTDRTSRVLAEHLLEANLAVPVLPDSAPDLGDVTVVIPVHNRTEDVARLLRLLAPHFPCIVADDASHDGPALARVVSDHSARHVRLNTNVGPAGARNAGLAHVTTEYVVFVDSDITVQPSDPLRLRQHFTDPSVAVVAPRVRGHWSGEQPRLFERYDATVSSLDLGSRSSLVRPGGPVAFVPSACLMARVAALDTGFDESLRVGEDVDLIWRLAKDGWRIRYDADIVVRHRTPATTPGWLARKVLYGSSAAPLAQRHGDAVAPAIFTATGALSVIALLCQRRWSVPAASICVGASAARLSRTLPDGHGRPWLVAELTGCGVLAAVRQTSLLLLRHWWPATTLAALISRRVRVALLAAALLDVVDHTPARPRPPWVSGILTRRLDDLAYGAGVWLGAARARSTTSLRPRLLQRPRRKPHAPMPSRST